MASVLRKSMYEMPPNPQLKQGIVDREGVENASELIVRKVLPASSEEAFSSAEAVEG